MTTVSPPLVSRLAYGKSLKAWRERVIALSALGIVAAIKDTNLTTVQRACDEFFTYDNYLAIKDQRLSADVRRLFEVGMELEDVQELSPGSLNASFGQITRLATKILKSRRGRNR